MDYNLVREGIIIHQELQNVVVVCLVVPAWKPSSSIVIVVVIVIVIVVIIIIVVVVVDVHIDVGDDVDHRVGCDENKTNIAEKVHQLSVVAQAYKGPRIYVVCEYCI
jgi:hypothetical protein